ncbi:MAG: hypothetical protein HRU20_26320 [Pseudomonadales bacterium]|nr:hypothetical protein [Pseudomonadales bacterium]
MFLFISHTATAILIGLSLLAWFFYFLWSRQQLVLERVEEKIDGQNVILPTEHIMFRAVESSGYSQTSGMGYMALTEEALYFELVLLDLVITVPVGKLQGAEFVRRLKGVSPVKKMLRILFINDKGEKDSIAVNVKDMQLWKNTITSLCAKKT